MATLLLRSAFQFHDGSPKNQAVVTTHVRTSFDPLDLGDPDATALCVDLADKWGFMPGIGATTPFTVSAYKRGQPTLGPPVAIVKRNPTGTPKALPVPPELSVVLSYFSGANVARRRGRMYMPAWLLGATSSDLGAVVPSSLRTRCTSHATNLASLGGANVDWGIWSEAAQLFYKASDVFVSDAWAIQRRRGIKETARTTATTSG